MVRALTAVVTGPTTAGLRLRRMIGEIAVAPGRDERNVTDSVECRAVSALADRQLRDLPAVGRGDDRDRIVAASGNDLRDRADRRRSRSGHRSRARAKRATSFARAVSRTATSFLSSTFTYSRPAPSARRARANHRQGRSRAPCRRRVDHRHVSAAGIHDPHRARRRIVSRSVGLGAGRDRRTDLAGAAVEQSGIVRFAIGRKHVVRAGDRKRGMNPLSRHDLVGRFAGAKVDCGDAVAVSDVKPLIGGSTLSRSQPPSPAANCATI